MTYNANIKLWDADSGAWVWKKISTKCRDEGKALAIASTLEGASVETKEGRMTRAQAENLVGMVLRLSGAPWAAKAKVLGEYGDATIDAKMLKAGGASKVKFSVHWDRFKEWAGERMTWPMERWTGKIMSEYYADLLTVLSERTANDHLSTLRMVFERARHEGFVRGNPVLLVEKDRNNSIEKATFTRTETARIVKAQRRAKRRDWALLTLLGWHTGHRLQDVLSVTSSDLNEMKGVGWVLTIIPDKKIHKGGRVVKLPIPRHLAQGLRRMEDFTSIRKGSNVNGKTSGDFLEWVRAAGIDPLPVVRKKRTLHLKTFHSFRHSMVSRLVAAGVQGETARLVTDHDSAKMQKHYTHAEIESLAKALAKARKKQ